MALFPLLRLLAPVARVALFAAEVFALAPNARLRPRPDPLLPLHGHSSYRTYQADTRDAPFASSPVAYLTHLLLNHFSIIVLFGRQRIDRALLMALSLWFVTLVTTLCSTTYTTTQLPSCPRPPLVLIQIQSQSLPLPEQTLLHRARPRKQIPLPDPGRQEKLQ